jgi:hypothetical protein
MRGARKSNSREPREDNGKVRELTSRGIKKNASKASILSA